MKYKVSDTYPKKFPEDLRHLLWRNVLNNPEEEKTYSTLVRTDKILTVSQFEMNVLNETRNFVNKHVSEAVFDSMMVQSM